MSPHIPQTIILLFVTSPKPKDSISPVLSFGNFAANVDISLLYYFKAYISHIKIRDLNIENNVIRVIEGNS